KRSANVNEGAEVEGGRFRGQTLHLRGVESFRDAALLPPGPFHPRRPSAAVLLRHRQHRAGPRLGPQGRAGPARSVGLTPSSTRLLPLTAPTTPVAQRFA